MNKDFMFGMNSMSRDNVLSKLKGMAHKAEKGEVIQRRVGEIFD